MAFKAKVYTKERVEEGVQWTLGDFSTVVSGKDLVTVHHQLCSQYNKVPTNMNMISSSSGWSRESDTLSLLSHTVSDFLQQLPLNK